MGLFSFWKKAPKPRPTIPVMQQRAVTQDDVAPAKPPSPEKAAMALELRRELAANLLQLSRRSAELRSKLVKAGLSSL